jgi:hypothetical protein
MLALVIAVTVALAPVVDTQFDRPIGGRIHSTRPGFEFGIQGDCWVADGIAHLQRFRPGEHVHIGRDVPIPGNDALVEVSMSLPELPALERGYLQLLQVTPSNGVERAKVVEVRMYPDRTLAVALHGRTAPSVHTAPVPVESWFTIDLVMRRGTAAEQRLRADGGEWVRLTANTTATKRLPRQVLGGTTGTLAPFVQSVDWWRITPIGRP